MRHALSAIILAVCFAIATQAQITTNANISPVLTTAPSTFAVGQTAGMLLCVSNGNPLSTQKLNANDAFKLSFDSASGSLASFSTQAVVNSTSLSAGDFRISGGTTNQIVITYIGAIKPFPPGDSVCVRVMLNTRATVGSGKLTFTGPANATTRYNPSTPAFTQLSFVDFPVAPVGPPGPQGPVGPAGAQGLQGPIGLQGSMGLPGPQGLPGATGQQGPAGAQGAKGDTGATGATGQTGATGPAGPMGPQGLQGNQGPQGATGLQGPKGDQGIAGAIGPQGLQGPIGATGQQGPMGQQGDPGPTGAQGVAGPIGPQGPQGDVGPQGPQGISGSTPIIQTAQLNSPFGSQDPSLLPVDLSVSTGPNQPGTFIATVALNMKSGGSYPSVGLMVYVDGSPVGQEYDQTFPTDNVTPGNFALNTITFSVTGHINSASHTIQVYAKVIPNSGSGGILIYSGTMNVLLFQ